MPGAAGGRAAAECTPCNRSENADEMLDLWSAVAGTVAAEFSDLPDAAQVTRIVLRLSIAAALGGLLGYERERKGKAAGVRTHMLVAMGAALFMLIPQQAGASMADLTRTIQGVVAGIGFLGVGAIVKADAEQTVQGLTTAAGIWMTAAIGIAAGLGRESTALLSTLLALLILAVVPRLVRPFERNLEDTRDDTRGKDASRR